MKRSPLRRTSGLTRTTGLRRSGRIKTRRPAAGAPRVKGRPALRAGLWKLLVADLTARSGGRCENPHCGRRAPLDPNHVVKTSQGGPDHYDWVVMICRPCHEKADNEPLDRKLHILCFGSEVFSFLDRARPTLGWMRCRRLGSPLPELVVACHALEIRLQYARSTHILPRRLVMAP